MKLHEVGSINNPLRPSKLDTLVKCTMQLALSCEISSDDEGGPSAQTGSLVHKALAAFHANKDVRAAWDALTSHAAEFPLADHNDCRLFLTPYLADSRNTEAEVVAIEYPIKLVMEPHEYDRTKQPIYIAGTLDQIRKFDGALYVNDFKSGKPSGYEMVNNHVYQLGAYTLGAIQAGFSVVGAKITRLYSYRSRTESQLFYDMPFDLNSLPLIMSKLRLVVALIRNGEIDFGPGNHCNYCEFGGLLNCTNLARERFKL